MQDAVALSMVLFWSGHDETETYFHFPMLALYHRQAGYIASDILQYVPTRLSLAFSLGAVCI